MRHAISKEQDFLKKIYKAKTSKQQQQQRLKEAKESELKALVIAVHLVVSKKVPLTQKIVEYLSKVHKKRIGTLKKYFGDKEKLKNLLSLAKSPRIKILHKYIGIIKVLLSAFFEPLKSSKNEKSIKVADQN